MARGHSNSARKVCTSRNRDLSNKNKIRLVHTSDIHLGIDWKAELSEQAFNRVVETAGLLEADALLVVDHVLEFYLDQVSLLDCPVVTLPGNHDLYHRDSLYLRQPFLDPPSNFHLFTEWSGQTLSFPELTLDLWGRAMPQHDPDFLPLAGMPASAPGHWLVALAHGHFHFPEDKELRSSPIWPGEVADAPCDYLALGHWERHVDVSQGSTVAFYSGSPLGAAPDDDHISVNMVDLDPDLGVSVRQVILPLKNGSAFGPLVADAEARGGVR